MSGTARAIYDYEARASDELSFKRHDVIMVLGRDEEDDGWYKGTLNGKTGLFPNNYVQFQEAEKKAPEPPPAKAPAGTAAAPSAPKPPTVPDYVKHETFERAYSLAETLGRGRFSQVRRCTQVPGGRSCAVKIMDLDDPELGASAADAEREVIAEIAVLRQVQHAGVVQLFETFKNDQHYYLVLEDLSGGDLFDRIEQNGPFKEEEGGNLLRMVVSAVQFLHEKGIVHRDIKPDNLVFDSRLPDAEIKLIDFGYAGHCKPDMPLRGLCGTPDYAAPEILTWYATEKQRKPQGTPYAQPVDMWSIGVVLYILLCGFPPFYGDDDEQMFDLIRSGAYSFPDAIDGYKTTWGGVSDSAKALVRSLLTVQPAHRGTASAVLAGEWLQTVCTPRGGWIGKMRERSNSGWRAGAKPDGKGGSTEGPRLDRGQIDRGDPIKPAAPVNTDAKMVFGDENYEGKLKYSLEQRGLVSQFSRWIVDRIVKREMRILMLGLDNSGKTSILYRLKRARASSARAASEQRACEQRACEHSRDGRGPPSLLPVRVCVCSDARSLCRGPRVCMCVLCSWPAEAYGAHDRLQCGDARVQEHRLHGVGCGWAGEAARAVAALLCLDAGAHLRRRLVGPRAASGSC